jgi:hypothetical protein
VPALRIVSDELWTAAKARQERTRHELKLAGHLGRARRPQYLFSGEWSGDRDVRCAVRHSGAGAICATLPLSSRSGGGLNLSDALHRTLNAIPMLTPLTHPVILDNSLTSNALQREGTVGGSSSRPCLPVLRSGDVLVSRPTARADVYAISVAPGVAHTSDTRYEEGMKTGRQLAHELGVDGWFTCDHIHFVRIATNRP